MGVAETFFNFVYGVGHAVSSLVTMLVNLVASAQGFLDMFNEELLPTVPAWLVPFPLFVIALGIIYLILGGRDSK